MNTLRITLLLSILMFPGVAFSTDGDPSDVNTTKSDQGVTAQNTIQKDVSHKTSEPTTADKPKSSKVNRGNLEISNENSSKNNASSLLGSAAALVCLPVKLVAHGIGKLAALKGLKDHGVGKWLTNHNKGLSRAVVAVVIGGTIYYYWKKCQKCKQVQDETSRTMSFDDDDSLFVVQDDEEMQNDYGTSTTQTA